MTTLTEIYPPFGVRITAGSLTLGVPDDKALAELADLAFAGIHDPVRMPFLVAWTETPPERFHAQFVQHHWGQRSSFSPERWGLDFAVWNDGTLVGTQGVSTHNFLTTRTGETGAWLGRRFHGRGIGTRMRQALCAFLFDHLDFEVVTSGAFLDNPASLAVSRKVGYQPNGIGRKQRREGEAAEHQDLRLTPETFRRGEPIQVEGVAALRRFVGLDA